MTSTYETYQQAIDEVKPDFPSAAEFLTMRGAPSTIIASGDNWDTFITNIDGRKYSVRVNEPEVMLWESAQRYAHINWGSYSGDHGPEIAIAYAQLLTLAADYAAHLNEQAAPWIALADEQEALYNAEREARAELQLLDNVAAATKLAERVRPGDRVRVTLHDELITGDLVKIEISSGRVQIAAGSKLREISCTYIEALEKKPSGRARFERV